MGAFTARRFAGKIGLMAKLPGDEEARSEPQSGINPRDGIIDFTRYSDAQLEELKYTIDPRTSPLSCAHLTAELERRAAAGAASANDACPGRFTARDGARGWLRALRRRSPVYGSGAIECENAAVVLRGWRRTWLGVPYQDEVRLPLEGIRNVAYANGCLVYDSLERDDVNIFEDTPATWSSMKEGFTLLMRDHPKSDYVVNGFARFACLGGDAQEYKELRPDLRQRYSATAWSDKVSLESCDKKFRIPAVTDGKTRSAPPAGATAAGTSP